MFFFVVYCSFCLAAPAVKWGKDNESRAREAYENITGFTVTPMGLTLHQQYPYLGATADGLVNDCIVVELKCPYSVRDKSAAEYQHIAEEDGKFVLKKTSPYYCQVQGEMAIKKVDVCHFVAWTTVDTAVIEVKFD